MVVMSVMSIKSAVLGTAAALFLCGAADARNHLDGDFVSRGEGGLTLSVRAMGDSYAVKLDSGKCGESLEGFAKADSAISRSLQLEKKLEGREGACYVQLGYDPKDDSYVVDAANCQAYVSKSCEFDGVVQRLAERRRRWTRHRSSATPRYSSFPPPQATPDLRAVEATQQQGPERRSLFGAWPF